MLVRLKLFAAAREIAGGDVTEFELADGATVAELRAALAIGSPRLAPLAERSLIAVNSEYAGDAVRLRDRDEVALIPPVSGG